MYKEIAKLILYRDLGEDSILLKLSGIFRDYEPVSYTHLDVYKRQLVHAPVHVP